MEATLACSPNLPDTSLYERLFASMIFVLSCTVSMTYSPFCLTCQYRVIPVASSRLKSLFIFTSRVNGATEAAPPYLRYVQVSDQAVGLLVGYLDAGLADKHRFFCVACAGKIYLLDRTQSCD